MWDALNVPPPSPRIWLGRGMGTDHSGPVLIDRQQWTDFDAESRHDAITYDNSSPAGRRSKVDAEAEAEARLDGSVLGSRGFNLQQPTNYPVRTRC